MFGIDTNVVIRLLVRDNDAQVRAAERFIATHCSAGDPGFVSRVVIAEVAWVLKDYYDYDRTQVAVAVRGLLNVSELELDASDDVHAALRDFESSSADFTDCLIVRMNASAGCEHTVTFDRKAAKLPGFKLLAG
jgi:predicted nucleic-acid-binding protein